VLHGKDEVTELDSAVGVEAGEKAGFGKFALPALGKGLCDYGLGISI
jgi:hypothetical protein